MPSLAAVTLKDGAATPADHVFTPVTTDGSFAQLSERVGVPSGFKTLTTHVRPPVQGNDVYKVTAALALPTLAVGASGAQSIDYVTRFKVEFQINARSLEQDRKDILAYAKNLLSHALATDLVVKLEPQY